MAKTTRLDITNAVREISRHSHDPREKNWRPILNIIEYVSEGDSSDGGGVQEVPVMESSGIS